MYCAAASAQGIVEAVSKVKKTYARMTGGGSESCMQCLFINLPAETAAMLGQTMSKIERRFVALVRLSPARMTKNSIQSASECLI